MAAYPPDLEEYVQQKVLSGQFRSREELEAEAIRVYRKFEIKHSQLKADVRAAIDESSRGVSLPLDLEPIETELAGEFGFDCGAKTKWAWKSHWLFRILLTPLALRDLKTAATTEHSRSSAFVRQEFAFFFLHSAASQLGELAALPAKGEICRDLADDVRRFIHMHQYLIFYRRITGGIEVLRVLDESRDVPAILRNR